MSRVKKKQVWVLPMNSLAQEPELGIIARHSVIQCPQGAERMQRPPSNPPQQLWPAQPVLGEKNLTSLKGLAPETVPPIP